MRERPGGPARSLKPYYFVAAIVSAVLVIAAITGFVWAQKRVTVVVDGVPRNMKTQAATVADLLEQSEIDVDADDVVAPAPQSRLSEGMTVEVRHSIPVTLVLAGEPVEVDVVGSTVADAVTAAGANVSGVTCEPSLDATLTPGMEIEVSDVFLRVVEEEVAIPFETVTQPDSTLAQGSHEVVSAGQSGTAVRVYRVLVEDGVEGARTFSAQHVVSQPVHQVVAVGTKRSGGHATLARATTSARPVMQPAPTSGRKLTVVSTAYAPGVDGVGTRTATGRRAGYGIIAVDPRVIPLGTRVYVPGYGYALAADTGGAIKGNRVDVCFDSASQARAWGRRTVTITILP